MEVNDYDDGDKSSSLIFSWIVACYIPWICLIVLLAIRMIPDSVIHYIRVGSC